MIADDANPERRTLWSLLAWLEGWEAMNPSRRDVVIQQEAKDQIEKIKRTLAGNNVVPVPQLVSTQFDGGGNVVARFYREPQKDS